MDWNSMQEFFKENWGSIIKETRRYHYTKPQDCIDELEKTYIEAKKTYNPTKTQNNNYQFLNHYLQYLRTALKQRKTRENREIYLEDIIRPIEAVNNSDKDDENNGNGHCIISTNGFFHAYHCKENHEDAGLKKIICKMISYGERKAKKTIEYLRTGNIEKAFKVMPQLKSEIIYLAKTIERRRKNGHGR